MDVKDLIPNEIGHAAGYEAYRLYIHNGPLWEGMMNDFERVREALAAIAIAEGKSCNSSQSVVSWLNYL